MKRLYEKSEWGFALLWIGAYLVLGSGAELAGALIGAGAEARTVLYGFIAAAILCFVHRNGLAGYYGLAGLAVPARRFLWFIPLIVISTGNFWLGVALPGPAGLTILLAIRMLLVGVIEELLFRGLLYRALERKSETAAIVISSVIFGLIHLINLSSGMLLPLALAQVALTTALGFLFALILARGKSLVPCIAAHCFIDVTSVFSDQAALTVNSVLLIDGAATVIALVYFWILLRTLPKPEKATEDSV
mgnify:CR=1 FL=1